MASNPPYNLREDNTQQPETTAQDNGNISLRFITKKQFIIVTILTIMLGLLLWQGTIAYTHWQLSQLVPASIQQRVNFPIFVPQDTRIRIEQSSFSFTGNVLQFNCFVDGAKITVTEQAKTSDFTLSNYAKSDSIGGVKTISTPNGSALVGTIGSLKVAILETKKNIVTLTGDLAVSTDILESIAQSLQQL